TAAADDAAAPQLLRVPAGRALAQADAIRDSAVLPWAVLDPLDLAPLDLPGRPGQSRIVEEHPLEDGLHRARVQRVGHVREVSVLRHGPQWLTPAGTSAGRTHLADRIGSLGDRGIAVLGPLRHCRTPAARHDANRSFSAVVVFSASNDSQTVSRAA